MKRVLYLLLFIAAVFSLFTSCQEEAPVMTEGNGILKITAMYDSTGAGDPANYRPMSDAMVILTSEYGPEIHWTNDSGKVELLGIPSAVYHVSIRKDIPEYDIMIVGNSSEIEVTSGKEAVRDIMGEIVVSNDLSIHELYTVGPVNKQYYFYDQFIEIYNKSDSVKYLDGMMVMRFSSNRDEGEKGPGADEHNDNDIDGVTYVFRFPGEPGETNFPIQPKDFVVLAGDAVNHTNSVSGSVDLSQADFEFVNQYSAMDIDNPNVPNLYSLRTDNTTDFLISLTSDVIILSAGVDTAWTDGIDLEDVIDGVEYKSSLNFISTLDDRVDRGVGIAPPKYSGKSMQRREPGIDTNDGTLDWEILDKPTPGYHK